MWNRETQRREEKGSMVVLRESDTERRLQVDSEFLEAFWYHWEGKDVKEKRYSRLPLYIR